jgi:hypothetical protein
VRDRTGPDRRHDHIWRCSIRCFEEVGFARDSPLEEAGFEPSVPRVITEVREGLMSPPLDDANLLLIAAASTKLR